MPESILLIASLSEASFTGLFRTIMIILIIYFLFRLLARHVFPALAKLWLKRFERKFYEQNPHIRNEEQKQEGDITIKKTPSPEKKGHIPDDTGEYVDYQDVNE